MSQTKTRNRTLAIIAKREATEGLSPETSYALGCGKFCCPILKSIENAFALGEGGLAPELVKLIELIPNAGEHYRNNESIFHQIARTGLEGMGFSLTPHPEEDIEGFYDQMMLTEPERDTEKVHRKLMLTEAVEDRRVLFGVSLEGRDPLSDSGIHIVKDPGFGYTD